MLTSRSHRIYITIVAIIILLLGIMLGDYMVENLGGDAIDSVKIGLLFTAIILILLTGTFVLEVNNKLEAKTGGKK